MSFSGSPSWGTRSFTFGDTAGFPKQRTPTPSVRQESVIENVEKKQRENLKSRLKLLSTLPSRSPSRGSGSAGGPSPMPIIVRGPPARVSLPKAVAPSTPRRYTSVLTSSDQQPDLHGPKSRLVRRHSVGSLVYQCPKERSPGEANGNGLKKDDFKSLSSFHIARDDSGFNLPESSFSSDRNNIRGTSSKTTVKMVRDDLGSTWPRATPESGKSRPANGSSYLQNSNFDFNRRTKMSNEHKNDDDIPEDKSDSLISFEIGSTPKHATKENEAGNRCNGNLISGVVYENKHHRNGGETDDLDDVFNTTNNFYNLDLKKDAHNEVKSPHDTAKDQQFTNGVIQPSETFERSKTNGEGLTQLINFDLPHGETTGELFADFYAPPILISKEVKPSSEGVLSQIELMHWDDDIEQSGKSESYAKLPGSGVNEAIIYEDSKATKQNNDKEIDKDDGKIQKDNELFDIIDSAVSNSPASLSTNNPVESAESAVATLIDLEVSSSCEKTSHDPVKEVVVKSDNCRSERLEIVINKSRDFGLGFCIEGGQGHPDGDRPITVKRVFADHPCAKHLKVGDELTLVAKEDMTYMSHINAWKFLRTLPDGDVSMTIVRHGV